MAGATTESIGSVWRRWDPHVHLPGTLHEDRFDGLSIADALDVLGNRVPTIEAVGVTDYCTTTSYRQAVDAWHNGAGAAIKLLFPNVELRLDVVTRSGDGVNIHLLCAPDQVDELDQFLGLHTFTAGGRQYRGQREDLVALGRAHRREPGLEETAALRVGAGQFKVSFEELRRTYEGNAWARANCLIAVAGGADGTSGVRDDVGGFVARRREIESFAHAIFSASPQQREFWLGLRESDPPEQIATLYGGLKPCLHGSDAHDEARLGVPDDQRYTWLKGDASFETLRMACLAPATRVRIGPGSPGDGSEFGRVVEVAVGGPSAWMSPESLPINPGLVAIIGSRGSGKTALADVLAVGAGCGDPFDNPQSFVRRAGHLLTGHAATVQWAQGVETSRTLSSPEPKPTEQPRGVRYLSQQFVDRLCSADGLSDALIEEIERVVFNAWPPDQRQGAADFQQLLSQRLASARTRQDAETIRVEEISSAITDELVIRAELPAKVAEQQTLRARLLQLDAQVQTLTKSAGATASARLAEVTEVLAAREQTAQQVGRTLGELESLQSEVALARTTRFPAYTAGLRSKHPHAALTDEQWSDFAVDFVADVDDVLRSKIAETRSASREVAGDPRNVSPTLDGLPRDQLETQTLAVLRAEQRRLEQQVGLDQQRASQLTQLNSQIGTIRTRLANLQLEMERANGAPDKISQLSVERVAHYAAYFDALLEQETELGSLYRPLREMLERFGRSVAKLRFSVRRSVDLDSWVTRGQELLDLRVAGAFQGRAALERAARQQLEKAWTTGGGAEAAAAISAFTGEHRRGILRQAKVATGDVMRRRWEADVARWLYDASQVTISYTLDYDGINIERLSPGSRGIVLLLLYLAVDQDETDPLIIDQPEENLDPESVYSELVKLFRTASERRQIIMVTHNANLVVNTDVDQVIVATCRTLEEGRLPTLQYVSGGLEQPEIRTAVCKVLEGGADAFRERARRLRIHLPGTR